MNKGKKSKIGLFIMVGFLLYFIYVVIDQQKMIYAKNTEMTGIQAKIDEENGLMENLKEQKEMINSNEYIEKTAREKLGMVKSGERVFVDAGR